MARFKLTDGPSNVTTVIDKAANIKAAMAKLSQETTNGDITKVINDIDIKNFTTMRAVLEHFAKDTKESVDLIVSQTLTAEDIEAIEASLPSDKQEKTKMLKNAVILLNEKETMIKTIQSKKQGNSSSTKESGGLGLFTKVSILALLLAAGGTRYHMSKSLEKNMDPQAIVDNFANQGENGTNTTNTDRYKHLDKLNTPKNQPITPAPMTDAERNLILADSLAQSEQIASQKAALQGESNEQLGGKQPEAKKEPIAISSVETPKQKEARLLIEGQSKIFMNEQSFQNEARYNQAKEFAKKDGVSTETQNHIAKLAEKFEQQNYLYNGHYYSKNKFVGMAYLTEKNAQYEENAAIIDLIEKRDPKLALTIDKAIATKRSKAMNESTLALQASLENLKNAEELGEFIRKAFSSDQK